MKSAILFPIFLSGLMSSSVATAMRDRIYAGSRVTPSDRLNFPHHVQLSKSNETIDIYGGGSLISPK